MALEQQHLIDYLQSLETQRTRAIATVHECDGAIQLVRHQLQRLTGEEAQARAEEDKAVAKSERKAGQKKRANGPEDGKAGADVEPAILPFAPPAGRPATA